jgi:hypothetical protein
VTYQHFRWSEPVWSPPPESNRRPPWGARSQSRGFSGGVISRLWCAVVCCRLVGGADGLVVRLPGAAPPSRVAGALLALDGCQRGRDRGPPPPAHHPAPPAPTASAPAQRPRATGGAQPPPAQAAMVDLGGHAPDAAWMAPPHGAPTLDRSSAGARPATGSRPGPDRDRTAGHQEPALGLPAHPRGAAEPWLPGLRQLCRQGPARRRPPAGTASSCQVHDLAVVPASPGSRHRGL